MQKIILEINQLFDEQRQQFNAITGGTDKEGLSRLEDRQSDILLKLDSVSIELQGGTPEDKAVRTF